MLFLDTNVFLYSIGKEHPHKEPCRRLLDAIAEERVEATTSAEVLQEILHVLNRRGQRALLDTVLPEAFDLLRNGASLVEIRHSDRASNLSGNPGGAK